MNKVLIDALGWSDNYSGLTTYCYSIIKELSVNNSDIDFTVLHNVSDFQKRYGSDFINSKINFVYLDCPLLSIRKELYFLVNYVKFSNYDIFYSLSSYSPLIGPRISTIATIHDLKYLNYPNLIGRWKSLFLTILIRKSLLSANRVIAVSNFTKAEVEKRFKSSINVTVVYEGPSKFYAVPYYEEKSSDFIKLKDQRFFLCVSEDRPHKNLRNLIKSFKMLLTRERDTDNLRLVIIGSGVNRLASLCHKINISGNVVLAESVDDRDMKFLYVNAHCLVFPSLYEGFGIPIVDAMYHSLPIITSDRTATREIAEEASILIDPDSVEDICDAMQRIFCDDNIHFKLATSAKKMSEKFCWNNCAQEIIGILESMKQNL